MSSAARERRNVHAAPMLCMTVCHGKAVMGAATRIQAAMTHTALAGSCRDPRCRRGSKAEKDTCAVPASERAGAAPRSGASSGWRSRAPPRAPGGEPGDLNRQTVAEEAYEPAEGLDAARRARR